MKRLVTILAAAGILGGCGIVGGKKDPVTPTVGQRIPVLSSETGIQVDPELAAVPVTIPGAVSNADWAQPGGSAAKSIGHLALPAAIGRAWAVEIAGSTSRTRLAAAPVVANGTIYVIDTNATVRALDAANGGERWRASVGDVTGRRSFWTGENTGNSGAVFGGGVSFDNGRVYATNGIGDVAAFDAATGKQIWKTRPGGPLRGAPTIAYDSAYVLSQDNQLYALNVADGSLRWQGAGSIELAGVFGVAAPAVAQGTVVAGFSSGELTAFRYENGQPVWGDALTRTSISTAVTNLSDVDADPVIDNGRVYAIGQGGRMVAIDLATGQRLWEINVAGISTPWVAGDWIYVVTDDAELLAVARDTGKVRWMTQLPRYRDEEDKKGPISWVGPVLAGDRLILASSEGQITNVNPADGAIQTTVNTKKPVSLPLVVANGALYVLHDDGTLAAWR
ncbi:PQQ-binding-like beta-propeller repeat protein [Allosphingosinicella flava]|uniref:PQQ-binding-like beta-propeller repeat protein n=1 Tax=Allosphingosinicella flava TaxID=2771430 RepID=A0A7T2GIC3_9SPHN|nr:PQQ-binding-like beta-propeller repeat protein [Sphingosinicella flava]QPQ54078.1 PQQ-binding-like beta-propeller repeat protein [Sphingosinicella flava]